MAHLQAFGVCGSCKAGNRLPLQRQCRSVGELYQTMLMAKLSQIS